MNPLIRYRLFTVVLLGVLTSALCVVALVQLLTTNTAHRVERARDAVVEEVDRLALAPSELSEPTRSGLVGMRAGVWSGERVPGVLPGSTTEPVRAAVARSRAEHARVITESSAGDDATLVIGVRPVAPEIAASLPPESMVFVTYVVRPFATLRTWQRIVSLLAVVTVLLVVAALYSVVTMHRGAAALRGSLEALGSDLSAKVPRPSVRELDDIADGIAGLAAKLAEARVKEERLARELSQNERLAALGRVAAGVAHEVRNPLASIKLRLDLAATSSSAPLPEAAMKAIAHATSEIERLDRLVADLLVVAGRAVGPKCTMDLGALVRARVDGLAAWARDRGVSVTASGEGAAVIDSDAMARAVDNLLRNAVEASPSGANVVASVRRDGEHVVVRVDDEGEGVASARAAELFEPFFTTKPAGTGLGLALSRAIARAHGGDVLYTRDAEITRFTLTVNA